MQSWPEADWRLKTLLEMLWSAAAAGQRAPTNEVICDALGLASLGAASKSIKRLEAAGLIEVTESDHRGRVVRICATGAETAALPPRKRRPGKRLGAIQTPGLSATSAWRRWLQTEAARRGLTEQALLTELAMLGTEVYREQCLGAREDGA